MSVNSQTIIAFLDGIICMSNSGIPFLYNRIDINGLCKQFNRTILIKAVQVSSFVTFMTLWYNLKTILNNGKLDLFKIVSHSQSIEQ